jgi:hypothetical protein
MPGRSPEQLVDILLVEAARLDASYNQDYERIRERIGRLLDKEPHPLPESSALAVADWLYDWLSGQAARNVPFDRLSQFLRCGLGSICVRLCAADGAGAEETASRAYAEMKRRGWDQAVYDADVAAAASRRVAAAQAAAPKPKTGGNSRITPKERRSGATVGVGDRKFRQRDAEAAAKAAKARKEALMALEKKAAAKKAAPKKAAPKKAVAKKAAPKKAAPKVAKEKKAAPKKAVAKKAVKKAVKKVVKKAVAKKAAPKKAAKKAAPKPKAPKKAAAPKPVAAPKPAADELKPDPTL